MTLVVHIIAAARPNFMKVAPLYHELKKRLDVIPIIVHTGQHYDEAMSGWFFRDFGLPRPHFHLGIGSGTHAEQAAGVLVKYEQLCFEDRPDIVVVVGDVNSTMAATLAATKLGIPVAHLEAGLRSFDRSMPEEVNRIVTDALADLLWTPSVDADLHLKQEGISGERVVRVGNIMIDTLEIMRARFQNNVLSSKLGLDANSYATVTFHRPSNVDSKNTLETLTDTLINTSKTLDIVFPVHPRTRSRLKEFGFFECLENLSSIHLLEPMSYIDFMSLVVASRMVITDSGGIQEETSYLNIPCLTLRSSTERPITITEGSNVLTDAHSLAGHIQRILDGRWKKAKKIDLWDGKAAGRVVDSLFTFMARRSENEF